MAKTMEGAIQGTARLARAAAQIWRNRWKFLTLAALAFAGTVFTLAKLDLLPEAPAATAITTARATPVAFASATPELPQKIVIPAIGLSSSVTNPESTAIAVLDGWLLKGAVRYPSSASLGENGNVVLFGHSSYLPIVGNPAYKTFNEIQKLKEGDQIEVQGEEAVYVYAVRTVSKENAEGNEPIPLMASGKELTLVTCNSFGKKSDRFIVVADFVESHAVPL